ncbi:RING finger domain-containing protein [Endozoicomonas sp. ALC020]|uniref:RING finger domain-containing protein n=2 Tax=unclassified Endozoicomonas TaxID=2644528 RepID=UPI003BB1665E
MNVITSPSDQYYWPATEYMKEDECPVCYFSFAEKEVSVTKCAHNFHTSCLVTWLEHGDVCPMCRTPLKERTTQREDSPVHFLIEADNVTSIQHPEGPDLNTLYMLNLLFQARVNFINSDSI